MGTRLAEETEVRPKPMIEIGGRPILWHILKHYAHFGFREFLIALGYRSESVKRFFCDYHELNGDLTVALGSGHVERHVKAADDWIVHLKDTGLETSTGGRVKRLRADVERRHVHADLRRRRCGRRSARAPGVSPSSGPHCHGHGRAAAGPIRRTGVRRRSRRRVHRKAADRRRLDQRRLHGARTRDLRYLDDDRTSLEIDALERLASERQLAAFRHERFWQCMDTLRDKRLLETLWQQGRAPWNMWT